MLFLRGGDGTGGNSGTINTGTSCSTIDNVNISACYLDSLNMSRKEYFQYLLSDYQLTNGL